MWFTESNGDVGRVTLQGSIAEFSAAANGPIVAGGDGAVWFTSDKGIGRITTSGSVTYFPTSLPADLGLVTGPDGNVWFGQGENGGRNAIGRITPSGSITYFPVTSPNGLPATGMGAVGSDGNIWFAGNGTLGRITTDGSVRLYNLKAAPPIARGPDGNVWVFGGNRGVMRVGADGATSEFALSPARPQYYAMTSGPDGALWVGTYYEHPIIGRIAPPQN